MRASKLQVDCSDAIVFAVHALTEYIEAKPRSDLTRNSYELPHDFGEKDDHASGMEIVETRSGGPLRVTSHALQRRRDLDVVHGLFRSQSSGSERVAVLHAARSDRFECFLRRRRTQPVE